MKRGAHIISYFSLPTDLAGEMRNWPEFVSGAEYSVDLENATEKVSVRYIEEEENAYVSVQGEGMGTLFDRVLGRVIYALSAHSDNLMISNRVSVG